MPTRRILLGVWLGCLVGCAGNGANHSPSAVVEHFIAAWDTGDNQVMEALLSERGQSNAEALCHGAASHCLNDNYHGNGMLQTVRTEVVTETAVTAHIRLHTTWSDAGERCQSYELEQTAAGWRVTFFSRSRKCPDTER